MRIGSINTSRFSAATLAGALIAAALVIPQGLIDRLSGQQPVVPDQNVIEETDRLAVAAVIAAERAIGRIPFEQHHNNPGFDILSEDPVTGSLNAGLGVWLIRTGQAPPEFTVSQGQALQRRGLVHIERRGADIWIGGDAVIRIEGALHIP